MATQVVKGEIKLCVLNFGKWKKKTAMEKVLDLNNILYKKVQKVNSQSFGFIAFETTVARDLALEKLQTIEFNGNPLEVTVALPKKSLKPLKRGLGRDGGGKKEKKARIEGQVIEATSIADAVTPWFRLPYAEQLARKQSEMRKVVVKFVRRTRKDYVAKAKRKAKEKHQTKQLEIPEWLNSQGSFYTATADGLFKENKQQEWEKVGDAANILSIVSFGGDLLAVKTDSRLYSWIENNWKPFGNTGKSVKCITAFRGELLCGLESGDILKSSLFADQVTTTWSNLGQIQEIVPNAMVPHNGSLYIAGQDKETNDSKLLCSSLDQSEPLTAFEPVELDLTAGQISDLDSQNGFLMIAFANGEFITYDTLKKQVISTRQLPSSSIFGFSSHKEKCCELESIRASPITEGYRNKCEFSIGFNEEGKPCVGFRLGLFKNGSIRIESPESCVNVSSKMKSICQLVQRFIETSDLPVYDRQNATGVWRSLLVRESQEDGLMVMLQANPEGIEESVWTTQKELFVQALDSKLVASIYLQEYAGVSAPKDDDPVIHLHGATHLIERLNNLKFKISPQAFFQVNTKAAEVLYNLVGQLAQVTDKTLLYDVCCGTGTIGLSLANQAGKVIGIELCQPAVDDANQNKDLNGIQNAQFIASKAEKVMSELLKRKRTQDEEHLDKIVAIVDPPRGGLHIDVIRALRACTPLTHIVYVSCNPTGTLLEDTSRLCGPETASMKGRSFLPTHAVPVDLFPHTPHCELVVVFNR